MIRTEREYQDALKKLQKDLDFLNVQENHFKEIGLTDEQISVAMEPLISFHAQLKEEVEYYQKIKRGDFGVLYNLENIGRYLIGLRIYQEMSQSDLANKLGVAESQISRDERNEYHGATIEKIQRVLTALGVKMKSEIDMVG